VINFNSYKKDLFLLGFRGVHDKREKGGAVLRTSRISGFHLNYKNAIHKPNFRMKSENSASLKYYPQRRGLCDKSKRRERHCLVVFCWILGSHKKYICILLEAAQQKRRLREILRGKKRYRLPFISNKSEVYILIFFLLICFLI
jgi:hypothetical protein